jgi:hypothetical protein
MKVSRDRERFALLWTVCFLAAMAGALYLRWYVGIGPNSASQLFELIIGQYAPYVGAVVGFYLATKASAAKATESHAMAYKLAMAMSSLWKVVVVGFVVEACLNSDRTVEAMNDIRMLAPKLSWAVAPAIGYFFGKPTGEGK